MIDFFHLCVKIKVFINYMKKSYLWLLIGLVIILSAIFLRLSNPRSRWVCKQGQWYPQGEPQGSRPTTACRDELSMEEELKALSALFAKPMAKPTPIPETEIISVESVTASSTPETKSSVSEDVVLISPAVGEAINSPYLVTGQARGSWFFEASLPIMLRGASGRWLTETNARAQSDWMTNELVPFQAELLFDAEGEQFGEIIIKKDNPSGLPEYDAWVSYPVIFKP